MLTDKDIDKLMQVLPTKDEVRRIVDEQLEPIIEGNQKILSIVEGLASRMDGKELENAARDSQLTRHDGWIHQIAKKTKVRLED